jgi:hypothetical protein
LQEAGVIQPPVSLSKILEKAWLMPDLSDYKRLVDNFSKESATYYKQFIVWVGVSSAAAATALISFVVKLPDINYAFYKIVPSLWCFLLGVSCAALSVLFISLSKSAAGGHFAEAYNREQYNREILKRPHIISSPPELANNSERDRLIERSKIAHDRAEMSWANYVRWNKAKNIAVSISCVSFVLGVGWPVAFITFGGKFAP